MGDLRGVQLVEGKIGINVAGDGREFGLIANGVAVVGKAQLGVKYTLRRPSDAVAIGIDAAYDVAHSVQVYRHISEFFRLAGEGRKLHLMLLVQTKKPIDMVVDAQALAVEADGAISDMAFAFNPAAGYTETQVDGLNADVKAGITALQTFADWADVHDMPLHTILECRGLADSISSCADLRGIEVNGEPFEGGKVTLVAGQDWAYADGLSTLGKKFADVGTFLGNIASQPWNRNPGEVQTQNLMNAKLGIWTVGGLSNHKKYTEVYDSLDTLDDKGYVFPIRYQGLAGYWWNDGHVCAPIVVDSEGNMNQHTIYYSHTMDMCKRALRLTYLPEVKKPVSLVNGKLPTSMVDFYDSIGNITFDKMAGSALISEGKTFTDADSDLLVAKLLNVQFSVIPTGCVNEIKGTINLKNQ